MGLGWKRRGKDRERLRKREMEWQANVEVDLEMHAREIASRRHTAIARKRGGKLIDQRKAERQTDRWGYKKKLKKEINEKKVQIGTQR